MINPAVKCSLCDTNHAEKKWDVNVFDSHSACCFRCTKPSQLLPYLPSKLHLKCDCSWIHLHKTGFKTCTLTAPMTLMCSTLNHPSRCPIWKSLSCLFRQGTYNKGVGKTPCFPTEAWCCSGYFQTARVLHHFHPVARDASLWCCTTICWRLNRRALSLSHAHREIDFSVCHWWHCMIAVFKLAAAW